MCDVIDFETHAYDNAPHITAELICVKCCHRWIGCWPEQTWLKDLSCPNCKTKGTTITTGQYLSED